MVTLRSMRLRSRKTTPDAHLKHQKSPDLAAWAFFMLDAGKRLHHSERMPENVRKTTAATDGRRYLVAASAHWPCAQSKSTLLPRPTSTVTFGCWTTAWPFSISVTL